MSEIKQAMILAAGMGSRMKELTHDIPKPMLLVSGTSLIERHLNYLYKNDIHKVIINTHYKAETLEKFVLSLPIAKKLEIYFSREEELLGTAGGVKNALKYLGKEPFFIINSDAIYVDDDIKHSAFSQLEENWRLNNMSMLILLATKNRVFGYYGKGDFNMNEHKQLVLDKENGEFIHIGMTITDYRIFKNHPEKVLQFQNIYQDFMLKDEIYGYIYQGQWLHIGDIRAYNEAPALISPSPDTVSI